MHLSSKNTQYQHISTHRLFRDNFVEGSNGDEPGHFIPESFEENSEGLLQATGQGLGEESQAVTAHIDRTLFHFLENEKRRIRKKNEELAR